MVTIKDKTINTKQYRPFVKWVGGKRGIVKNLLEKFPGDFENYHEPFLGGGAVFFELYSRGLLTDKKIFLSDVNAELINTFKIVKSKPQKLIDNLETYKEQHSKEFYYDIRALDRDDNYKNLTAIDKATRFIYLNKTCFNGLYRVNKKGQFNTPMGSYKNPRIAMEDEIFRASEALQNVSLKNTPFTKVIKEAKKNDLVYLDPPYYPLNNTSFFTSYDENVFLDEKQQELFKIYQKLDSLGCYVIESNSDTAFIKKLFSSYSIDALMANRFINSKGDKRQKIQELVIRNFNE